MDNTHNEVPGSIYLNNGRYYWKVKLPGEKRRRAIPLKPSGSQFATKNRDVANAIAGEMWQRATSLSSQAVTIKNLDELCDAHLKELKDYHSISEYDWIKLIYKQLSDMYGDVEPDQFSPLCLKRFRDWCIHGGDADKTLSVTTVNKKLSRVKKLFKWAVSEQICSAIVAYGLETVAPLKNGRSKAKPVKTVKPAAKNDIFAVLDYLTPTLRDMVTLQYYSGMRAGEMCDMKAEEIDTSGKTWIYTPGKHKTKHKGKARIVAFGPHCQKILHPRLIQKSGEDYIFSPRESEQERLFELHLRRKTPINAGNRPGTNRRENPQKKIGEKWQSKSYQKAIKKAFARARKDGKELVEWTSHQLRHSAATEVRKMCGLETASAFLGHADIETTKIYAERAQEEAVKAAEMFG
jgi:integrase